MVSSFLSNCNYGGLCLRLNKAFIIGPVPGVCLWLSPQWSAQWGWSSLADSLWDESHFLRHSMLIDLNVSL